MALLSPVPLPPGATPRKISLQLSKKEAEILEASNKVKAEKGKLAEKQAALQEREAAAAAKEKELEGEWLTRGPACPLGRCLPCHALPAASC